jgi:hypothetical protein
MRLLMTFATLAVVATTARADNFVELAGGMAVPIGDSTWTNTADASPKIGVRAGAIAESGIGAMLQFDWTPVNLDATGGSFGVGSTDYSAHRFRFLANGIFHHMIAPHLLVSARMGAGIDIAHGSATLNVLGNTSNASDTDVGFGFEAAGGLWFQLGSMELGGELALPIAAHSHHATSTTDLTIDYTSYDIDLMVGVRVFTGR